MYSYVILCVHACQFVVITTKQKFLIIVTGLSLRAGGWGFSLATNRVAPGYFYWKIEEK